MLLGLDEPTPEHSTISRTRRLLDLETHRAVFTWILQVLATADLVKGTTIGIDATTLEANAALRNIVRRDSGETYQEFLTRLAQASGIETPTRAYLARLDRTRPKKGRNTDWRHPHDPDARITKMKDGRTHRAQKAEHAVDVETGAIVGVTVQGADQGDTTTIADTVTAAAEDLEAVAAVTDGETAVIDEVVADKGYHSNRVLVDLASLDLRTYIAEPDRGRRRWTTKAAARDAVYANRRRLRGARGRALQRRRSERLERPNAHLYDTGGMRRTHLRGHANILKRVCIHVGGFNLGLFMRTLCGVGTPRSLQGHLTAVSVLAVAVWARVLGLGPDLGAPAADDSSPFTPHHRLELLPPRQCIRRGRLTTGCYDTVAVYETATARGATVVIPPARTANVSGHGPRSLVRDRTITLVKQLGRRRWKKASGYHRQSRVENTFFRYKSLIGDGLRARSPAGQGSEVVLGCEILNRMTELGRPVSYRIGR